MVIAWAVWSAAAAPASVPLLPDLNAKLHPSDATPWTILFVLTLITLLPAILMARLICCIAISWGGLLIVPGFYGFFLSAFAAPALLEGNGAAFEPIADCLSLIHHAAWRLTKLATAICVAFVLASLGVLVLHLLVVNEMMGSLLDLNVSDLSLTLGSRFWVFSVVYLMLVAFDFYWTVASVMVFYDLRSRRLGSDLRLQMREICSIESQPE